MGRKLSAVLGVVALLVLGVTTAAVARDGIGAASGGMGHAGMGPGVMGHGGGMGMVASEFDYLAGMIPHHEEAVEAARILVTGTDRPELRTFGKEIIETQTKEIAQMRGLLARWYPGRDTDVEYVPMMRDLTGLTGDALDRAFLVDMIPHHHMAVMMSHQLLHRDLVVHAAVRPFAESIAAVQSAEIRQMRDWLAEWFGGVGAGPGGGLHGSGGMHGSGGGVHGPGGMMGR